MYRIALLSLLISAAATAADKPAPPLHFEAGVVLAGGYVLAESVTLSPVPGLVTLRAREGAVLHWRVAVQDGETLLLQQDGRWAARAEYNHTRRAGRDVCLVYQTTLSPEWAVHGRDRQDHADIAQADDKVYSFRDIPCP